MCVIIDIKTFSKSQIEVILDDLFDQPLDDSKIRHCSKVANIVAILGNIMPVLLGEILSELITKGIQGLTFNGPSIPFIIIPDIGQYGVPFDGAEIRNES